jgi:hypothetical protein
MGRGPQAQADFRIKSPDVTEHDALRAVLDSASNCEAFSRLLDLGRTRGCYPNRNNAARVFDRLIIGPSEFSWPM